jgi:hypothetical protein
MTSDLALPGVIVDGAATLVSEIFPDPSQSDDEPDDPLDNSTELATVEPVLDGPSDALITVVTDLKLDHPRTLSPILDSITIVPDRPPPSDQPPLGLIIDDALTGKDIESPPPPAPQRPVAFAPFCYPNPEPLSDTEYTASDMQSRPADSDSGVPPAIDGFQITDNHGPIEHPLIKPTKPTPPPDLPGLPELPKLVPSPRSSSLESEPGPSREWSPTPPNSAPPPPNSARARQIERQRDEDPGDLTALRRMALDYEPIDGYEDCVYDGLRLLLVNERRVSVANHQLLESERLTNAIKFVDESQLYTQKMALQMEAYANFDQQVAQLQAEVRDFDQATQEMEDALVRQQELRRQRLRRVQDFAIEDHERRWTDEAKTRQYNHASTRLVFLRGQFKLLMTQCRFREAEDVRLIIEKTEQAEQAMSFACLQRDYDESLAKIQAKQKGEVEFFEAQAEIQKRQLRQARQGLRATYAKKERKVVEYEKRIADVDKLWNQRQTARINDIASGTSRPAMSGTITKMSRADITVRSEKEENLIALPPLRLKRSRTDG